MRYLTPLILLLLLVGSASAESYNFQTFACGESFANKQVSALWNIANEGGLNIFHVGTDLEDKTIHLYGNKSDKKVMINGTASAGGDLGVHVNANYGEGFTLSLVSCKELMNLDNNSLFFLGLFAGAIVLFLFVKIFGG